MAHPAPSRRPGEPGVRSQRRSAWGRAMLNLETATILQVDEAVEANLVVHMSWAQSRLATARVIETRTLVLVDSGFACDTFNFVCRARLRSDVADRVSDAIRFFADVGHPFSWWAGPLDEPADLGHALEGAGLVAAEPELGMICSLSKVTTVDDEPSELRIVRAKSPKHVADFAAVVAANWDPPDALVVAYYEAAAPVLLGEGSPLRLYVGYVGESAVATAEVCMAGGVAGLYGVSTATAWRRRGYGTAMTARALAEARGEGARVGVLQASNEGQSLYARLGFRPHGQYVEYQPADWLLRTAPERPSV